MLCQTDIHLQLTTIEDLWIMCLVITLFYMTKDINKKDNMIKMIWDK